MTCTALKGGRCSIYANRPYICRIWGAHEKMRCPFGCKPSRMVTEKESRDIIKALGPVAVEEALKGPHHETPWP
jgi:hypothetical protein